MRHVCRLNLIQAVEGDDWSSVIDAQTAETAPAGSPAAAAQAGDAADAAAAPAPPIESPFARASVHRTIGVPHRTPHLPSAIGGLHHCMHGFSGGAV